MFLNNYIVYVYVYISLSPYIYICIFSIYIFVYVYIYIYVYIFIYIYIYTFSFSNFPKRRNNITFSVLMYTESYTLFIKTLKITISNTKHNRNTKIHFRTSIFQNFTFPNIHPFQSTFSAYFHGPPLAGVKI